MFVLTFQDHVRMTLCGKKDYFTALVCVYTKNNLFKTYKFTIRKTLYIQRFITQSLQIRQQLFVSLTLRFV